MRQVLVVESFEADFLPPWSCLDFYFDYFFDDGNMDDEASEFFIAKEFLLYLEDFQSSRRKRKLKWRTVRSGGM